MYRISELNQYIGDMQPGGLLHDPKDSFSDGFRVNKPGDDFFIECRPASRPESRVGGRRRDEMNTDALTVYSFQIPHYSKIGSEPVFAIFCLENL